MYGEVKIYIAKIIELDGTMVKVEYTNTKSNFIPYLQLHNSFKTHFIPPRINEIVLLIRLGNKSFVIGSILPPQVPLDDLECESIIYSDGTKIKYKDGVLSVDSLKELTINCKNVKVNADSIILGGDGANINSGVVTGECICPFTGSPHGDFSKKVKAVK